MTKKELTPEEQIHQAEHRAHVAVEVVEAAAGAIAGAAIGVLGGPVGMVAGAALGAAAGAVLGAQAEQDEHRKAEHDKDLDRIGLGAAGSDEPTRAEADPDEFDPSLEK